MTMAMKNPPRRTTIRGQKHLLAYITPEEAKLLMDNGGSGEPGPMGIPAFYERDRPGLGGRGEMGDKGGFGGDFGGGGKDNDVGKVDPGLAKAAADKAAEMAAAKGPAGGGISPGQSQAMFGTPQYAGLGTEQAISAAKAAGNQFAGGVEQARAIDIAALQNLNRQLENLSRREQLQKDRINSLASLIPGVGAMNYLGLQNVRNLASSAIGQPPGFFSSLGFGSRISPDFRGLSVSDLVGLQSQAVTDDMGNILGFRDEYGTLKYGKDPNELPSEDRGPDTVPASYNPNTGEAQCPNGYTFDEDLQACRLSGGLPGGDGEVMTTSGPYEAGDYARMGLLDVAPMGMGLFADRYGAGFGTPSDFSTANLAFRRGSATRPQYFKQAPDLTGYTLLS
jgi:hypothetical protein